MTIETVRKIIRVVIVIFLLFVVGVLCKFCGDVNERHVACNNRPHWANGEIVHVKGLKEELKIQASECLGIFSESRTYVVISGDGAIHHVDETYLEK